MKPKRRSPTPPPAYYLGQILTRRECACGSIRRQVHAAVGATHVELHCLGEGCQVTFVAPGTLGPQPARPAPVPACSESCATCAQFTSCGGDQDLQVRGAA
jgi:hypothetical protein